VEPADRSRPDHCQDATDGPEKSRITTLNQSWGESSGVPERCGRTTPADGKNYPVKNAAPALLSLNEGIDSAIGNAANIPFIARHLSRRAGQRSSAVRPPSVGVGRRTVLRGGYAIDMLRGLAEKRSREPIASIRLLSAGCRRHLLTLRFNSSHPWMLCHL
jgi:hypothetical protein